MLFLSDRVLHRVLPAQRERFCFTVWLDGEAVNSDEALYLKKAHLGLATPDELRAFMCGSPPCLQDVKKRQSHAARPRACHPPAQPPRC